MRRPIVPISIPRDVEEKMDVTDTSAEDIEKIEKNKMLQEMVDNAIDMFKEAMRLDKKGDSYKKAQSDDNAERAWNDALSKIENVMSILNEATSHGYQSETEKEDEENIKGLKDEIIEKLGKHREDLAVQEEKTQQQRDATAIAVAQKTQHTGIQCHHAKQLLGQIFEKLRNEGSITLNEASNLPSAIFIDALNL
jgi:hypothetical protein